MALTGFSVRIDGPANEIEWVGDEPIGVLNWSVMDVLRPPRPQLGGDAMVTSVGIHGPRQELPLWPRTPAGRTLRWLYVHYGERALCEPGAMPWWADNRESW